MRTKITDAQPRMDGGINTASDDLAVLPNQVRRAENCRLTTYGALTLRYGSEALGTLPQPAASGFLWYRDNGDIMTLLAGTGTGLYRLDMGFPAVTGTLAAGALKVFAKFVHNGSTEAVYIADGASVKRTDGATITSTGSIALAFVKGHNQRLWGVGNATFPQSLFYSGLNDGSSIGDTGNGGGQIIVRTFGDEALIALASVGSSLMIFHRRGISRLTGFGQDDIGIEPEGVSGEVSLLSQNALVEVDGACFFLTNRGLYIATEGGVRQVATPEQPDPVAAALQASTLAGTPIVGNDVRMSYNAATQELLCFVPGYGTYIYHLVLRAWAGPWTGEWSSVKAMVPLSVNLPTQAGAGVTTIVLVGNDDAVSLADNVAAKRDRMTDLADRLTGDEIVGVVRLRRMFFGDDALAKAFRFAYITTTLPGGSQMTMSWATGNQIGESLITAPSGGQWGVGAWGDGLWGLAGSRNYQVPLGGNGYYLDITLGYSGYGVPVISRASFEAFPLGRR